MKKEQVILFKFNLQHFAELNTNVTTDAEMSKDMKEYYDTELLRRMLPKLIFTQFGKRTPMPKGQGQNPRWRRFKSYEPALTPLQEGITPAGKKSKLEVVTGHTEQYGDYTAVSDRLNMEAMDPVILELTKLHGEQGSNTIDLVTRNEVLKGTNVLFAPKADGTKVYTRATLDKTCTLTPKVISIAKTILKRRNANTIGGSYIGIIHPDIENDVITHPLFIDVNKYGDNVKKIYEGEIGKLYGVRFVVTSNAKIWNNSSAEEGATPEGLAVYACMFIGEDSYGTVQLKGGNMEIITKQLGSGGTEDPLNQRATVGFKVTGYDTKILNNLAMVRVECCSADFSDIAEEN